VKRIRALDQFVETRGSTFDNLHTAADFKAAMAAAYGGSRLGRQELDGELIEDVEGSLWPRALIEKCRVAPLAAEFALRRVVAGVDPPASAHGDACGILVCGLGGDGLG
jgi:phage terminase large subunit-like protein